MQQQINLKDLTVTELKALAYDILATIENNQRNLNAINSEIAARNQQQQNGSTPTPLKAAEITEEVN